MLKLKQLTFWAHIGMVCLWAGSVSAQSYLSPGYIMGEIRDGLGFVKPEPAPDFVVRGRPDSSTLDYVPLKPRPRGFGNPENFADGKLAAEAKSIAELEAARSRSQARAAGASSPKPDPKLSASPVEENPAPMKWNAWDTE